MSDNKMMAIIVIAICAAITITVSFRPDAFEDVSVTKFKASEKTKQLEIQFKIDSLKVYQNNGKK